MAKKKTTKKLHFQERRKQIKVAYVKLGKRNLNKSALARQFKCDRKQIYKDIAAIEKLVPQETIDEINKDMLGGLRSCADESRKIVHDHSLPVTERLGGIREFCRVDSTTIKHTEDFGDKEKFPDKMIAQIDTLTKEEREAELLRVIALRKKEK